MRPSIVRASIIRESIECIHSCQERSPVDAGVVLGPSYLNAAAAPNKVVGWAGLLRAVLVVVGCDAGIGVVVFARREGGWDGESAGAQCHEDK